MAVSSGVHTAVCAARVGYLEHVSLEHKLVNSPFRGRTLSLFIWIVIDLNQVGQLLVRHVTITRMRHHIDKAPFHVISFIH